VALTTHLHIEPRLKKKYLYSSSGSSWPVRVGVAIYTGRNVTYFEIPVSTTSKWTLKMLLVVLEVFDIIVNCNWIATWWQ
jgi:hypothetical protein